MTSEQRTCSLIMPYYDNPVMLDRHVREWLSYPLVTCARLRVMVVDDGSPHTPALSVVMQNRVGLSSRGLDVRVYRVVPDIPWNQDGARNLGMRECGTEFALMTDMDHLLRARDAMELIEFCEEGATQRAAYWLPRQFLTSGTEISVHANTFLFRVSEFWEMGGYDEDFAGHYGSDGNFRKCARGHGLRELAADFGLVVHRREDICDANTRGYGRKESDLWAARDPVLNAKRRGPPYRAQNPIRFEWRREF